MEDGKTYYAHTLPDEAPEKWERLETHLNEVSELAGEFAKPFGAEDWARLAGLWHDLGKYSEEFQGMLYEANGIETSLETKTGKPVHSSEGAFWAIENLDELYGRIFAYCIMGHHAGLADYASEHTGRASLKYRLGHDQLGLHIPECFRATEAPKGLIPPDCPALWIRMLFSCLVDADFLATERFMNPTRHIKRHPKKFSFRDLDGVLTSYLEEMCEEAEDTPVNKLRKQVLDDCWQDAERASGIRTLTVPTGGGKTLSSLAFAVRHAALHEKSRIIYVIPYTSIIEQTADVFRSIPGLSDVVVEHHSNLDPEDEKRSSARSRLAAENWDAPIIVTTNVQFFESLFASKPSRCRKLHRIVNSVVIFDEAQTLPIPYLQPVVNSIRDLADSFGVTPILCTATQPALGSSGPEGGLKNGLDLSDAEIIQDPDHLHQNLRRTTVCLHETWPKPLSLDVLAEELKREPRVLCILHSKTDALALHRKMPEGTYHLSTRMCGAHRSEMIQQISADLMAKKKVRVISTQVVEAGVDFDFPVVYRAVAGLDSIAQAAGRCNRNGYLDDGHVVVFQTETKPPRELRAAQDIGRELISETCDDPLHPSRFTEFFEKLFWTKGEEQLDRHGIGSLLERSNFEFQFRSADAAFRLIQNDWQRPVIVDYGEAMAIKDRLLDRRGSPALYLRKLQRYTVQIPAKDHEVLLRYDYIRELSPEFPDVYIQAATDLYKPSVGLVVPDEEQSGSMETQIV